MKKSHRKILDYLISGADIWAPANGKLAWVVLPQSHPRGETLRIRTATLDEMTDLGLVENGFGIDNRGDALSDNVWVLSKKREKDDDKK